MRNVLRISIFAFSKVLCTDKCVQSTKIPVSRMEGGGKRRESLLSNERFFNLILVCYVLDRAPRSGIWVRY
jgi:hypothetical protein